MRFLFICRDGHCPSVITAVQATILPSAFGIHLLLHKEGKILNNNAIFVYP